MADLKHPETIGLHGSDYRADPATTSVAVPIYQTTSYQFKNAEHAANLFGLKEFGNIPSRGLLSFPMEGYTLALDIPISNKTFELVEKLNVIVKKNHGKIYLSKDSSLEDLNLVSNKKNLIEFKKIRKLYNLKFESFQSKRLGL